MKHLARANVVYFSLNIYMEQLGMMPQLSLRSLSSIIISAAVSSAQMFLILWLASLFLKASPSQKQINSARQPAAPTLIRTEGGEVGAIVCLDCSLQLSQFECLTPPLR